MRQMSLPRFAWGFRGEQVAVNIAVHDGSWSGGRRLHWWRTENDRLQALLIQNGIAPSLPRPVRQTVPSAPGNVKLSTSKKVVLFRSLLRGREDVYARRWESPDGRSGYSPTGARGSARSNPLGSRASTWSFLFPAFRSVFSRGSHSTTQAVRGFTRSYSRAALVPSSKAIHKLCLLWFPRYFPSPVFRSRPRTATETVAGAQRGAFVHGP
jgi:hypothetical protein